MDIIRDTRPQKRRRALKYSIIGVVVLAAVVYVMTLDPAVPSVDAATIFTDTVKQGPLVREIRGPGTLVPEEMRLITAVNSGRIDRIVVLPGVEVTEETVLVRMSNPEVEINALQSLRSLGDAETNLVKMRSDLRTRVFSEQSQVAQIEAQYLEARRNYEINQQLYDINPELVPQADLDRTKEQAEDLRQRFELQKETLELRRASVDEEIEAQQAQVSRLREIWAFDDQRVQSLVVEAGYAGVLAEVPLQEGQWVTAGQTLARIVRQKRLKAQLQIPQTQAQEIVIGQTARIDTRNDTIIGTVSRIDPAVINAQITIDVSLPDELPPSARPELSVDGLVEINRLDNVIHAGKPTIAQPNRRIGLFKLVEDGEFAERVSVQVGITSVNRMEVIAGLQPGDIIIMSDMSNMDGADRIRIRR